MAAASDLAGAMDVRDAALDRFCSLFQQTSPKSAQILQMMRDAISAKKPGELDLKAIDGILENIPKERRGNTAFPLAAHLTANGRLDDAKRYWVMVAEGKDTNYWWRVIALSTLRERYAQGADGKAKPGAIKS